MQMTNIYELSTLLITRLFAVQNVILRQKISVGLVNLIKNE